MLRKYFQLKKLLKSQRNYTVFNEPKGYFSDKACLEFGPGDNLRKGFVGVDIRDLPGVKYVCNAWEIDQYVESDSIDEIYSRHFLEHLTFPQVVKTLEVWNKILVRGGRVVIVVPDLMYHIAQFVLADEQSKSDANEDWTCKDHAIAGFWGWQREGDAKFWDVHKSGFSEETISKMLVENGYHTVKRLPNKPWHLHVEAFK